MATDNKSSTAPKVTVVMSVYNGERYLREAIDSILNQTFKNLEFLIIDDGSFDKSTEVINSYRDIRIKLIQNKQNIGLAASLNNGILHAKGEYIARMDCDDICLPQRLEKQVLFMDTHEKIAVCGCWIQLFGMYNTVVKFPLESDEIQCCLLIENVMAHPAVIMRKNLFVHDGFQYNENLPVSQDYDLWVRISQKYCMANIGEVLLKHRWHEDKAAEIKLSDQINISKNVQKKQLNTLDINPSEKELDLHSKISFSYECSYDFLNASEEWLMKIASANKRLKHYNHRVLLRVLAHKWYDICNYSSQYGLQTEYIFQHSPLSRYVTRTWRQKTASLLMRTMRF